MADIIVGVTNPVEAARIINEDRAKVEGNINQSFSSNLLKIFNSDDATNQERIIIRRNRIYISKETLPGELDLGLNLNNTIKAKPSGNFEAVSFTPFTGCHIIPNEGQNFKIGELICIEAIESEDKKQPEWHGRYAKKGENGIFGIVFDEYEEPKPIPEVGVNKFYSVACLGDMKVFCNNENGDIQYGDELCASSKNGVAMKFTGKWEDRKQICGKAGRSHTFTSDEVVLIDTAKE